MAFIGNYEHTLDDKGRVAIPAKYRADFPGRRAIIIPLSDGCLQVYPEPAFREMLRDVRAKPVTDLKLSIRARKALQLLDIQSLGDLVSHTEAELMGVKNFGATSLVEVRERLVELGLGLRLLEDE